MLLLFEPGNPLFQSVTLPFGLSVAAVFVLARVGYGKLAAAAAGIGFLAAYLAILGLPPLPPSGSLQKLGYVGAAGLLIGVFGQTRLSAGRARQAVVILAAAGTVMWLGWSRLGAAGTSLDVVRLAVVGLVGAAVLLRIDTPKAGIDGVVNLLLMVVGLAGIAFVGATAVLAQTAGALAAAIGGFLVWNWPTARYQAGLPLSLAAGGAALAMTAQLVLFTQASGLALVMLAPILVADRFAATVVTGKSTFQRALRPVAAGLFGLLCVVAATAVAHYQASR